MDQVEMNANEGDGPKHPIHLLPSELRGAIFNKLDKEDVSRVRLVCKQWAKDALDYYNYDISLNEDSSGLEFILQLRIVTLRIKKLFGDRIQISRNSDHEASGKLTFKYPDLIRKIVTSSWIKSRCSSQCLHELIKLLQKQLTFLALDLDCISCIQLNNTTESRTFPPPPPAKPLLPYDLPNLKTCVLESRTVRTVLWSQIVNSSLPKVQEIEVILGLWGVPVFQQVPKMFEDIVKLMTKNPVGLEKLTVRILRVDETAASLRVPPQELSKEELVALKLIKNVRAMNIVICHQLNYVEHQMFTNLIGQQEKMEELRVQIPMMSADSLRYLPLNSFETIVKVCVPNLVVNADNPLDLAVFNNCSQLDELTLRRDWDCPRTKPAVRPELINLDRLPATRIFVSFVRLDILSTDIVQLLSSDYLSTLHLDEVGSSGALGVNSAVLERMEGLESMTLDRVVFVEGKRSSDCKVEVAKRKDLIERLGFSSWLLIEYLEFIRDENNRLRPIVSDSVW